MLLDDRDRKLGKLGLERYRKTPLGKCVQCCDGRVGAPVLRPLVLSRYERVSQRAGKE